MLYKLFHYELEDDRVQRREVRAAAFAALLLLHLLDASQVVLYVCACT